MNINVRLRTRGAPSMQWWGAFCKNLFQVCSVVWKKTVFYSLDIGLHVTMWALRVCQQHKSAIRSLLWQYWHISPCPTITPSWAPGRRSRPPPPRTGSRSQTPWTPASTLFSGPESLYELVQVSVSSWQFHRSLPRRRHCWGTAVPWSRGAQGPPRRSVAALGRCIGPGKGRG